MVAALVALVISAQAPAPDCVVVCPAVFRQAIEPLLVHRAGQGHEIVIVRGELSAEEIRRQIRLVAQGGRLRFVLLVGDCRGRPEEGPAAALRCVPTHYAQAEVNVLWGSEPYLAGDNWYADLDDDDAPEVALGRLSVDTPEQLDAIVAKILAYERSRDFGPWRRQLNLVAGLGGFGILADTAIESTARWFILRGIPASYNISTTFASWASPYCPDPRFLRQTVIERLNEGVWLWVYIGHGSPTELDRARLPGGIYPILAADDVPQLAARHSAPLALFLCCYAGAMDAADDCLAERMLRQPGGPVAAIAGSRVTMPYGMGVLSTELMSQCFSGAAPTLGEALLGAKRKMVNDPASDAEGRAMLDAIASLVSPRPDLLGAERVEHVRMFSLFGDPMLRLRWPKPVEISIPRDCPSGQSLPVTVLSPLEGRCLVELTVAPGRLSFRAPAKSSTVSDEALAQAQTVYQRANDLRLAVAEATMTGGRLEVRLAVPREARGRCGVRAFIQGADDFAMGAAPLEILDEVESEQP